jgi:hypothetical protein
MMQFPIQELLSQENCYEFLCNIFHQNGLRCPKGHELSQSRVHDSRRAPILIYRCRDCDTFFNIFTGTVFQGTRYDAVELVSMLRGFAQGIPTLHLANELGRDRGPLLAWRHKLQGLLEKASPAKPLDDDVVEADELYQNAGEKRDAAPGSRRSAASSGQPSSRAWNVGHRSSPRPRGRRSRVGSSGTRSLPQ